ncbi:hypothetical protein ACQY0O_007643 [Thecaphora frezii]
MHRTASSSLVRTASARASRPRPPARLSSSRVEAISDLGHGPQRKGSYSTLPAFLLASPFGSFTTSGTTAIASANGLGEATSSASASASSSLSPSSSAAPFPNGSRSTSSLASFFDQNATRAKPQSLFPHPQRSTDAIAGLRAAIAIRDSDALASAYHELVEAFHAHRRHLHETAARWQVEVPIGHARHDFQIRKADLQTAVKTVLLESRRSGSNKRQLRPQAAQLARRIIHDIQEVFGYSKGPMELHYLLWSYCDESPRSSTFLDPMEAFTMIRQANPTWRPTSVDFSLVLNAVCRRKELVRARELVDDMQRHGVELDGKVRNTIVMLYFSLGMVEKAEQHLRLMGDACDMKIDTLTVTVNGYCMAIASCGHEDVRHRHFADAARRYAEALMAKLTGENLGPTDRPGWLAMLRYVGQSRGPAAALETARKWIRPEAFDARYVSHLLMLHQRELEELQTSDEALALVRRIEAVDPTGALHADRVCYTILISSLLGRPPRFKQWTQPSQPGKPPTAENDDGDARDARSPPNPNQVREAQLLYDHLLASGFVPDAAIVTPLIFAYCDAFLPSLPSAMKLMDDLLRFAAEGHGPKAAKSKAAATVTLDTELFNALLRGCAKIKDVGAARALLRLMVVHNVRIDETSKVRAATLLMQCSSSWTEAFEMYRKISQLDCKSSGRNSGGTAAGYSAAGYATLLDVYRKLQLPPLEGEDDCAPPDYVMAMLEDMLESGYHPSCAVYTSLLDYYAKLPRPSYAGVAATHALIKLDERLEPDLPLINALMNAYNRVGSPRPVVSIWENLMANRQEVDGATLAIVFDTAGRHGMLTFARKALAAVRRMESERWLGGIDGEAEPGLVERQQQQRRRRRSAMNKGAWDAWIECLARCGRLEEAMELAFGSMSKQLLRDAYDAGVPLVSSSDATAPTAASAVSAAVRGPVRDAHGRIVGPDAKTMQMLLKFAAAQRNRDHRARARAGLKSVTSAVESNAGRDRATPEEERSGGSLWHEIRARIKEEMPWVWDDVKGVGIT